MATVHDMLKSVSLNYVALSKILLAKEEANERSDVLGKLTCISRTDLEVISEFLVKFKIWMKHLESDKTPTLWMVWPTYIKLNKHLQVSIDDCDLIQAMKTAGRAYILINKSDFEPKMLHKIGTVLHPLLKNIAIASSEERENIYTCIREELKRLLQCDSEEVNETVPEEEATNQDILDDFFGRVSESSQSQEIEIRNQADELQMYLNAKMPISDPFEFKLYDWWFENRHTYKNLFRLFLIYAGVCASSAPSERSFSTTGLIVQARRSCLLPETVQNLILARNKYLNYQ